MSLLLLLLWSACNEVEKPSAGMDAPSAWPDAAAFDTVLNGKQVHLLYLKNGKGMRAAVTNYGARMVAFEVPDSAGQPVDIVLGFPGIRDYILAEERFFGAVVGRFGNRIARGIFVLDNNTYQLDINNPPNTLHGGRTGFTVVSGTWSSRIVRPFGSVTCLRMAKKATRES